MRCCAGRRERYLPLADFVPPTDTRGTVEKMRHPQNHLSLNSDGDTVSIDKLKRQIALS